MSLTAKLEISLWDYIKRYYTQNVKEKNENLLNKILILYLREVLTTSQTKRITLKKKKENIHWNTEKKSRKIKIIFLTKIFSDVIRNLRKQRI